MREHTVWMKQKKEVKTNLNYKYNYLSIEIIDRLTQGWVNWKAAKVGLRVL